MSRPWPECDQEVAECQSIELQFRDTRNVILRPGMRELLALTPGLLNGEE